MQEQQMELMQTQTSVNLPVQEDKMAQGLDEPEEWFSQTRTDRFYTDDQKEAFESMYEREQDVDLMLKGQMPSIYGNQEKDLKAFDFDRVSTDYVGEDKNFD
jgi:hypothetical protein